MSADDDRLKSPGLPNPVVCAIGCSTTIGVPKASLTKYVSAISSGEYTLPVHLRSSTLCPSISVNTSEICFSGSSSTDTVSSPLPYGPWQVSLSPLTLYLIQLYRDLPASLSRKEVVAG